MKEKVNGVDGGRLRIVVPVIDIATNTEFRRYRVIGIQANLTDFTTIIRDDPRLILIANTQASTQGFGTARHRNRVILLGAA